MDNQKMFEKLTWGDFYSEESIEDNERLMRYEESYNKWDMQNDHEFNHMYDWENEEERYKKYLEKVRNK